MICRWMGVWILSFGVFNLEALEAKPNQTCLRASDCYAGLACIQGTCTAECKEDVDCPTMGLEYTCQKMLKDASLSLGGGEFSNRCLPRSRPRLDELLTQVPKRAKIHPEITGVEFIGETFWIFSNIFSDPQSCALECEKQRLECRAWVMLKPSSIVEFPKCVLLRKVIEINSNNGSAVSGYLD